jgi:hypothetical protein
MGFIVHFQSNKTPFKFHWTFIRFNPYEYDQTNPTDNKYTTSIDLVNWEACKVDLSNKCFVFYDFLFKIHHKSYLIIIKRLYNNSKEKV